MSLHVPVVLKHKREPDDEDIGRAHNAHPGLATVQRSLAGLMIETRSGDSLARAMSLRSLASLLVDPEIENYNAMMLKDGREAAAIRARELLSDDDHRVRIAAVNLIACHAPAQGQE